MVSLIRRSGVGVLIASLILALPSSAPSSYAADPPCIAGVCPRIGPSGPTLDARLLVTRPGSDPRAATRPRRAENSGQSSGSAAAAAAAQAEFDACIARNATAPIATICGFIPDALPGGAAAAAAGPGVPPVDPAVVARVAVARLPIPMPEAKVGPDPSVNEWNMAAVGYPLWFWTEGPDEYATTVTEQGITLSLTAHRQTTRFDTGDGDRILCGTSTPWNPGIEPGAPSPTCGHVYERPSLPNGTFAVTATTVWNVEWAALGQSGTIPFERTGPVTPLPVGELHAVRTR